MEIITAEQAREMVKEHIPYEIKYTVNCIMEQIKNYANDGNSEIDFDYTEPYFTTMKSKKFKDFITSLGYKYQLHSTERWSCYTEWITISW